MSDSEIEEEYSESSEDEEEDEEEEMIPLDEEMDEEVLAQLQVPTGYFLFYFVEPLVFSVSDFG